MNLSITAFVLSLIMCGQVTAFGFVGHFIIGEATYTFLSPASQKVIARCGYLQSFNDSLGKASVWADKVKHLERFKWTRKLHYFDAINDPPASCGIIRHHDPYIVADGQNLLAAIQNVTQRALLHPCICLTKFDFVMLIHFLQDLHQPLHLTGKARGGNEKSIELRGKRYNLHGVWDSLLIDLYIRESLPVDKRTMRGAIEYLTSLPANHTSGGDPTSLIVKWANDVMILNCLLVWKLDYASEETYIELGKQAMERLMLLAAIRSARLIDTLMQSVNQDCLTLQS